MNHIPPSVQVLREGGALDLREITRRTAQRTGFPLMYAQVDGVLRQAEKRGLVRACNTVRDYRETVWEATSG